MNIYPKLYLESVKEISIEILYKNNIKGIILDVDNTLIDFEKKIPEGIKDWVENMKKQNIKLCILSNSNRKEKIKNLAGGLKIPFIYFAKKPLKKGFQKAKQILDLPNEQIAVVGDQIFTDIIGANRNNMFPILVKPIDEKDIWITKIKRPIENRIIEKFKKVTNEKKV